jgi:hypothetical protein
MQNKANFMHFSPEKGDFTKKQSQFKPNLIQNKPNSNPIWRKAKNESFCADKEPYDCINNATRGIYHPKGCQNQRWQSQTSRRRIFGIFLRNLPLWY